MRVSYIDKLKGLAILFVVMGHVTEYGLGVRNSSFNLFYHSFHMPLFMFLSGLFAYKSFELWNFQEALVFLRKKTLRILLPFFVCGGVFLLLSLKNSVADVADYVKLCGVYWFFPALFYCMLAGLLAGKLFFKLSSDKGQAYKIIMDFIICCLIVLVNYMLDRFYNLRNVIPYFGNYTAMFPFFYMGVLCSRHKLVKANIFESERMYTLAVISYFLVMLWLGGARKISGCFAIIILLQLFIKHEKSIPVILSTIGKYSLEIYAFHWFLLPALPPFLQDLIVLPQTAGISNSNFILLFVMSFLFAVPIIGICIVITICIRKSSYLNMFVFGYKSEKIKY